MAATAWHSNAELIADVARLGYLSDSTEALTLDPTYGRGVWWKKWRPKNLVCHDKFTLDGVDFRHLPHDDNTFDAVAFDPPYVCTGGRKTTTIPDFHDRYGIDIAPSSPAALQHLIAQGLMEMHRVVKPRGIVLVKCQDYISSGKLYAGTFFTQEAAVRGLGFELVDRLEMISKPRPQPAHRRQVHARRNLSTLFVLKAPK